MIFQKQNLENHVTVLIQYGLQNMVHILEYSISEYATYIASIIISSYQH